MAQRLIKINYVGEKCAGLYLVDDDFGGSEITKAEAPQGRGTYKLVLRQTVQIMGKGKVTSKETYIKQGMTFLKAIQSVIADREAMKQRIIDKVTGVTAIRADKAKAEFITVDGLWQEYFQHRITSAVQGKRQKKWAYYDKDTKQGKYGMGNTIQSAYNGLVKPTLGNVVVLQLKKKHIEDLINKLIADGYSARYTKGVTDILRPMIDWYFDREEIDKRNPAGNIAVQFDNVRHVELPFEDMQKLYKVMFNYKDKKYRNAFLWLATGRRAGEMLSLHTDNVKGSYYTITAENNKAGVSMIYKMTAKMTATLPKKGYVHTSVKDDRKQLSKASLDRHWKNIKRDSHCFDLHMHDLRHLIATSLKDSGVPLEVRSWVLGHKVVGMTGRYERDSEEQADTKALAVDLFLGKMDGTINKDLKWHDWIKEK